MRSQLKTAAWALNGVPSWNLTPLRSLKVRVSPSFPDCPDSASRGMSGGTATSACVRPSAMAPVLVHPCLHSVARARFEALAQPVPDEIEPECDDDDDNARNGGHVGGAVDHEAAAADHHAPVGRGRLDSEAEKAQAG